jgi:hypothetical protein
MYHERRRDAFSDPFIFYYVLNFGRYLSSCAFLPFGKKGSKIMFLHHISSALLIVCSFLTSQLRFGVFIMTLLDAADPFLHLTKALTYISADGTTSSLRSVILYYKNQILRSKKKTSYIRPSEESKRKSSSETWFRPIVRTKLLDRSRTACSHGQPEMNIITGFLSMELGNSSYSFPSLRMVSIHSLKSSSSSSAFSAFSYNFIIPPHSSSSHSSLN